MGKHNSCSSSSEGDERYAQKVDDKKRKRMISNRESARRSRMRREQHVKDLNSQIAYFNSNNREMAQKANSITQNFLAVELENQMLAKERDELTKRLESLEMVSSYVCGYAESEEDASRFDLLQPWPPLACSNFDINGLLCHARESVYL